MQRTMKSVPDLRKGGISLSPSKDDSCLPNSTLPMPTSRTAFGSTSSLPIIIQDESEGIGHHTQPQVTKRRSPTITPEAKRRRKSASTATATGSPISHKNTKRPPVIPYRHALSENNSVVHDIDSQRRGNAVTHTPPTQSQTANPSTSGSFSVPDADEDSTTNASDDEYSIKSTAADDNNSFITSSPSLTPGASAPQTPANSAARPARIDTPDEIDQNVKHFLAHPSTPKDPSQTGSVYILRDPACPGWVKIGSTGGELRERRKNLESSCGKQLYIVRNEQYPSRHYKRVEMIVHRQLSHFKRPYKCSKCGARHREWFEIDEDTARQTVQRWMRFVKQDPWAKDGDKGDKITPYWKTRLNNLRMPDGAEQHDDHAMRNKRWDRFVDITWKDSVDSVGTQISTIVPPFVKREWSNPWRLAAVVLTFLSWWFPYECLIFWMTALVALVNMCSK